MESVASERRPIVQILLKFFFFKVKLSNTKTFLLACPGNQVRFGDHCYEEASQIFSLVSDNDDVLKNADACATVGGVLWYPETVEEIVEDTFILPLLHFF